MDLDRIDHGLANGENGMRNGIEMVEISELDDFGWF
jgi:hypothetical protein